MTCVRTMAMLLALGLAAAPALGQKKPAGEPLSSARGAAFAAPVAPLPPGASPVSSHAPYEAGECAICHAGENPKQPGPVRKPPPELCLDCHEDFAAVLKRPNTHPPARSACTACHNPHNSAHPKLLRDERPALCTSCHINIRAISATAKFKHGALSTDAQCSNCHDPHGSSVERLLRQLPFDLCLSCHDRESVQEESGKKLQNIKAWLAQNPVWHGPVASKDCSSCHEPHGAQQFRLLKYDYPPEFYAPYDARNYALCFSCHEERAFSTPETTTLTGFRDGPKNLHYVHLQQGSRGRTCRACHEVHASKQAHHIREGVPYGRSGWVLKLHYKQSETGGSCEKTCHRERSYSNRKAR